MDINEIKRGLATLLHGFDTDAGLPVSVYDGTCILISNILGPGAKDHFARLIEATDGCFYFDSSEGMNEFVDKWLT